MTKNSAGARPGRPKKAANRSLQVKVFAYVLTRFAAGVRLINCSEVGREFGLSAARARSVLAQLSTSLARLRVSAGGVAVVDDTSSYYWSQRTVNTVLKELVARSVAEFIPARASVACSPGTSVALAIEAVLEAKKFVNVMTNNCGVLDQLTHLDHVKLDFTGGTYDRVVHACTGKRVASAFRNAHFSHALVGVSGVDRNGNLLVKHATDVEILEEIVNSTTEHIYVLATVDKLAQSDMYCFGVLSELKRSKPNRGIHVVTNPMELFPLGDGDDNVRAKRAAQDTFESLEEFIRVTARD